MDDFVHTIIHGLTIDYPSRNAHNLRSLSGAAEFLVTTYQSSGIQVESAWYDDGNGLVRNLIVHRPGRDDGAPLIVVGAHYDTVLGTPGADDNASGVAGVMELARRIADGTTRHPVSFVLFPHEEPPFFLSANMGSRRYAASLRSGDFEVSLMLSLEMIGYARPEQDQHYPFPLMRILGRYPKKANFLAVVGNLRTGAKTRRLCQAMRKGASIPIEWLSGPGFLPPLFLSDHSSFWKYGFPAVMITDTAFLRNPHYHLPTDTVATLNFDFLFEAIAAVEAGIHALDAER